jgi:GntR family transcriptional regulator, transcriptional repressor for pyruvate dehydrogenase complex
VQVENSNSPHETAPLTSSLTVERVRPAYEQVASQLRDLIIRGEISPGERLPVESELPALFGVSRGTIREALRVLSSQSLVATRRGVHGGTFVMKPEPRHVGDYLEASLGLMTVDEGISVDELIEVREMLEVPAAGLAAKRRTDEDLEALHQNLGRAGSTPSVSEHLFEVRTFHRLILDITGNSLLQIVTRPVFSVLQARIERAGPPANFWEDASTDHAAIVAAIESGDERSARQTMFEHLEHLRSQHRELDATTSLTRRSRESKPSSARIGPHIARS